MGVTSHLTYGFRVLPHYANDLRKQYNRLLVELAKSDLLAHIMGSVLGTEITVSKLDPDMWKDIEQAEYALS